MAQLGTQVDRVTVAGTDRMTSSCARRMRRVDDSRAFPLLLLTPILIFFVVFNIIPLLWLIGVSFYRFKLTAARDPIYVGFDNYRTIWNSTVIWQTIGRTLTFMVLSVGFATLFGCLLGLLFWGSAKMPGRRLALTLLFTPMILPPVAVGTFYRLIYEPTFGILNWLTDVTIHRRFDFLGDKDL